MQGDEAAMRRESAWANGRPDEPVMRGTEASVAAYRGQLGRARELMRHAMDMTHGPGSSSSRDW